MNFTLSLAKCTGNAQNCLYPIHKEIKSAEELKEAVAYDHVAGTFKTDYRSIGNFQGADCIIGTAAKKPVKTAYRQVGLKKHTGALYKSIQKKVFKNAKAVMVQAKAQRDGKTFYGYALARGSKITVKNKKCLTFQIDGKWIRTHSVQLKAHAFVEAPVKRYLLSSDFKAKLDQLVEKEVIKIEKKARKRLNSSSCP